LFQKLYHAYELFSITSRTIELAKSIKFFLSIYFWDTLLLILLLFVFICHHCWVSGCLSDVICMFASDAWDHGKSSLVLQNSAGGPIIIWPTIFLDFQKEIYIYIYIYEQRRKVTPTFTHLQQINWERKLQSGILST